MPATDAAARARVAARVAEQPQSLLGRLLNLIGAGVVGYALLTDVGPALAPAQSAISAITAITVAAWIVRVLVPLRWTAVAVTGELVMIAGGTLAAVPTNGLAIAPAFAGIVMLLSRPSRPIPLGVSAGVAGVALIAVGALLAPALPLLLLGMEGVFGLAAVLGFSRRRTRLADATTRLLLEERVAFEQERARSATLIERSRIARDIHDVLAHSLGGLVIQLDAVEALLEAGDIEAAEKRVADARALAASGLGEARRAVDALREPDDRANTAVAPVDFERSLHDLLNAHRSLGATVDVVERGDARPLDAAQADALYRALQESLSNSRKHAPGAPVTVVLEWAADRVMLTVTNRMSRLEHPSSRPSAKGSADDLAITGGGHGLTGMRERLGALALGGTLHAGEADDNFVVTVRVNLDLNLDLNRGSPLEEPTDD
ncbi:hypothetical protein GCM10022381_34940 [Leifsonia kafniensis]|uniref:histidine kinase n=1 Tax=Leifsonia kafniensis TaxID=475957 RepID=A0ABP7L060_9MICO